MEPTPRLPWHTRRALRQSSMLKPSSCSLASCNSRRQFDTDYSTVWWKGTNTISFLEVKWAPSVDLYHVYLELFHHFLMLCLKSGRLSFSVSNADSKFSQEKSSQVLKVTCSWAVVSGNLAVSWNSCCQVILMIYNHTQWQLDYEQLICV